MDKKDLNWKDLGFLYRPTKSRYMSVYKDGAWDTGGLVEDPNMQISESAGVLQYGQACFEGLKAYTTQDGRIVTFRPELNARRLADTCERLVLPAFPEERFIAALDMLVRDNAEYVPPYGYGATLYIRPFMIGSGPVLAVGAATECTFRMYCSPVGPLFSGKSARLITSDYDRAAPHGTGHIKAGLNYAMSLYPTQQAKDAGFSDALFLDAATHTKVEEGSGANILFATKDGRVVTPKSDTILPSITRRSLLEVARTKLGLVVEERDIPLTEVPEFAECGLCGTAAVITPVASLQHAGKEIAFPGSSDGMGPVLQKLYDTLTGMQFGLIDAPEGWIHTIVG